MYRRSTEGFTLVEVLMSLAIAAIVIGLVISFLPKAAGQSTERALDTQALTRANKLVSIIDAQFRPDIGSGTFVGFSAATASHLKAAFQVDGGILIPPMLEANRNIHELRTVRIPGFQAVIGQDYLVLGTKGIAKLVRALSTTGDSVTFDCPLGIRSDGDMLIFTARSLELQIADGQLFRTVGDRREALAPAEGLAFKYVYADSAGTLTDSPTGTPRTTNAGNLVAFYPSAVTADRRGDRTTAIPTAADNISQLLTCEESAVKTPDEARINASILGLPSGATPDVMIYGPDHEINGTRVPWTKTYTGVDAGEYRLEARDVTFEGRVYKASVGGSPQRLWNTWGSINMAARYALTQGTLRVQATGLPSGIAGVALTGANNYTNTLNIGAGASVDTLLEAGTYTITPGNVQVADYLYVASPATATVIDGQVTTVDLNYTPITGMLIINVSGLPIGASTPGNMTGPQPRTLSLTNGSVKVANVAPGNYAIPSARYQTGNQTYKSDGIEFSMVAGQPKTVEIKFRAPENPVEPVDPATPAGNFNLYVSDPQNAVATIGPLIVTEYRNGVLHRKYNITNPNSYVILSSSSSYKMQTTSKDAEEVCEYPIGHSEDVHCFITSSAINVDAALSGDVTQDQPGFFKGKDKGLVTVTLRRTGGGRGNQGGCVSPEYWDSVTNTCRKPSSFP